MKLFAECSRCDVMMGRFVAAICRLINGHSIVCSPIAVIGQACRMSESSSARAVRMGVGVYAATILLDSGCRMRCTLHSRAYGG
jgi:hypothetical protein